MKRFVNTSRSLRNPDVNEAAGNQDEDGESIDTGNAAQAADDTNVNTAGLGGADDAEDTEEDDSPAVYSLSVVHNGQHTDISARVASAHGYTNKRTVLPGHLTSKKLAAAIAGIASW